MTIEGAVPRRPPHRQWKEPGSSTQSVRGSGSSSAWSRQKSTIEPFVRLAPPGGCKPPSEGFVIRPDGGEGHMPLIQDRLPALATGRDGLVIVPCRDWKEL